MAFKEVYDCEILISEIDKSFKDRLWEEVCEAVVSEWSQLDSPDKREKVSSVVFQCI
jgi:hypothetical protein